MTLLGGSQHICMSMVSTRTLQMTCLNSLSTEPRDFCMLNSKIDLALTLRMVRVTVRMRKRVSEHVSLTVYHDPSNMLTCIFLEPHAAWNVSHTCLLPKHLQCACSNTTSPPSHCHISAISLRPHVTSISVFHPLSSLIQLWLLHYCTYFLS
jgi:hypothetical protein